MDMPIECFTIDKYTYVHIMHKLVEFSKSLLRIFCSLGSSNQQQAHILCLFMDISNAVRLKRTLLLFLSHRTTSSFDFYSGGGREIPFLRNRIDI
jgi:hypothetical protein